MLKNRLMKIAIWHNLHSGGGCRALQYHIQGLVEKGHQVEIWAGDPDAAGFMNVPHGVKLHKVPLKYSEQNPSITERFTSLFFEKDSNMKAMEQHCRKCASEINQGGFDVLFANSCFHYGVPFISRFVMIPKVLYLGEPNRCLYEAMPGQVWEAPEEIVSKWNSKFWLHFFSNSWRTNKFRVYVREERKNFQAFDKVLVNSYFSMESCKRAYSLLTEVCYLGVDNVLFKPANFSKPNAYVVGLGVFYSHKNPELAIRAVGEVKVNRPKLLWIGNMVDENYWIKMVALARTLDVELEVKKMVTDQQLVELLSGAICMIYSSNLEPFGFAPLEANACGTPVIAVAEGGVRETIVHGKNGFWVNQNPKKIAQYIAQLSENQELRKRMSQFSINNIKENWSLASCSERINQAIESMVIQ
jgi:glycosyltransferase involved in cell wall biosynthesis